MCEVRRGGVDEVGEGEWISVRLFLRERGVYSRSSDELVADGPAKRSACEN